RLQPATEDVEQELAALYGRMVGEGDRARDGRDWAAAAQRYWRALDRAPGLMPIWVQLGHVLKEHGDHFGAEAAYRRALLLDGSVADTHLQLGHLLKLQGRRFQAARAYATAIRLDPDLQSAHDSLHAVLGYSPNDIARFLAAGAPPTDQPRRNGKAAIGLPGEFPSAASLPDDGDPARFGPSVADALCHIATQYNVLWLSVIDWNYRIQRPQHLAMQLAAAGSRVFYISITFDEEPDAGAFRIVGSPHAGVFEVRLRVRSGPGSNLYTGLGPAVVEDLQAALDALIDAMSVRTPIVIVDHPAWHPVAFGIAGATVVYDCLDLATGFSNVAQLLEQAERALIGGADLVVAASAPLGEHIARMRSSVVIRNAADVDFFARGDRGATANKRPVIGYFGAIAEWFDIAWIEECAVARPGWEFRLIGRTDGCDISRAAALPNVRFCGERRYDELPALLGAFDVAVIPFKMTELIRCTNPVKFYEYMAAGKPVVSAPLPEVVGATELAYVADDASSFEARIAQALGEDCPALRERRRAWARQHSWTSRADALAAAIDQTLPPVSVIVLTYNNWALTERCLLSIRNLSDYPTLEILVVDNASTDATRQKLGEMAEQDRRIRVILNQRNLGFAAGNNVGLKAARGEYAILINNDTIVTRGWVRDLIRPMQIDPRIGLVGPLTNRIGNEQRVAISYNDLPEMASAARRLVRRRLRQRFEPHVLAFFCVALRRAMLDELGLLDETYGLGFFEDDDYCMRAARGGWKMVIADDVFVHHHHSAAFDALGETATEQMARNRRMFESRWGPWQPHQYRRAPGFGDAGSAPAD
ncbi:MAG TPA: glycosyltransferase, partial [Stellaceae bacterium]|nr:glycosyltransferase [Stellaceae bacterium]